MLSDRVSNPGPLTYESGALPIALRGPAKYISAKLKKKKYIYINKNARFGEQTLQIQMKWLFISHFIWIYTVCKFSCFCFCRFQD